MKTITIVSIWTKPSATALPITYDVVVPSGSLFDMLEAAFILTNQDDRPLGNKVCSTSSGDLMILDGEYHLVQASGFKVLSAAQAQTIMTKLTSRDTSCGFFFMRDQDLIPAL